MADPPEPEPQQITIPQEDQASWERWVEEAFPEFTSRAYFLPPVYTNRVPMSRQLAGGQDVLVRTAPGKDEEIKHPSSLPQPTRVQESDVKDDAAMQRIFICLKKLAKKNKDEGLFGLSQLKYGKYLGGPSYAPAASRLGIPANRPGVWEEGDFDVLLIHQRYGFVMIEVKSFGDNIEQLKKPQQAVDDIIKRKLEMSISQLDKGERVLTRLVSDLPDICDLRIRKIIAFPNLSTEQIERAISGEDELIKNLCQCLGTTDPTAICGHFLCQDQLSGPQTPWEISEDVLNKIGDWWHRCVVVSESDSHMEWNVYKKIVARFCGPATTVPVPFITPPNLCVKTLGEAVSAIGEFYSAHIMVLPEQVKLLCSPPRKLFLAGPPGTGKTVLLLLIAKVWVQQENHVYILSISDQNRAVCTMLYHALKTQFGDVGDKIHLLPYNFDKNNEDMNDAINEMPLTGQRVHVIADEVGSLKFREFIETLEERFNDLHLWAASYYDVYSPAGWQIIDLTRPLRSPPAVIREVEKDKEFTCKVMKYTQGGFPNYTDGPPVERIYHGGPDHAKERIPGCTTCGQKVADFLRSLGVGGEAATSTSGATAPPGLQYKDVLVLVWQGTTKSSAFFKELSRQGFPVKVMLDKNIDDVALARSNVVWVADGYQVRGLERKVVVVVDLGHADFSRLLYMSRCTSQLVEVCYEQKKNLEQTGRK